MSYNIIKNRKLLIKILHSRCDLCGCCVGICPEDALELTRTELSIIGARCTNCAKCVLSCPIKAIELVKDANE